MATSTTADLLRLGDGNVDGINVVDVLEAAPFLAAMHAKRSSHETTHTYYKKTSTSKGGFRTIGNGVAQTRANRAKVTHTLELYDAGVEEDLALVIAPSGDALMNENADDKLRGTLADMEKQIIYGTGNNATGFSGLANQAYLDDSNDAFVIDAEGTAADTGSSVWMVRTGESDLSAVFANDGEIEIGEGYRTVVTGANDENFDAYKIPILFWSCLQIGSTFTAVRIANLTEESGKGLTDDLLSRALELFPTDRQPNLIAMSKRSRGQLQRSRTATNPTGAEAPRPTEYEDIPIVPTEQISDTESLLTPAA